MTQRLATIDETIQSLRDGNMIILVDDENRENEGDLIIPADITQPDDINFMATHGRGLICLAMSEANIDRLDLPPMAKDNTCKLGTAFTVSIDANDGVTTGISSYDRALTIRKAANQQSTSHDFSTPGHIFPLRARNGGVLERAGHTEASVDLSKLAGFGESAVICEILKDDGHMARLDDLRIFAQKHNLKIASINDLIAYRKTSKN